MSDRRIIVEPDAMAMGFESTPGQDGGKLVAVTTITPADEAIANEEGDALAMLINKAQLEAIRRVLIKVFGDSKKPKDAIITLVLLCYVAAPHLLKKNDLDSIAKEYGTSKQVLSYRLRRINEMFNLRSRNQKSDTARQSYSNHTKAWHKARKAEKAALANIKLKTKHVGKLLPPETKDE